MRRTTTLKRGRIVPLILVGGIGYLIGGWRSFDSHSVAMSAAQSVASRFPGVWNGAPSAAEMPAVSPPGSAAADAPADAVAAAQLALFSPEPMVPEALPHESQAGTQGPAPSPQDQLPAGPSAVPQPSRSSAASDPASRRRLPAAAPRFVAKGAAAAPYRRAANRPGYMLDDAQIVSIKQRLHLTSDQERMWPAVEAALRNIAYARAQDARGRGAAANSVQSAAVDPNAVQGLRSAAVPLILSFNAEQKEEVRNLAHIMGLDQLASEF
jgi:hypothetical protein